MKATYKFMAIAAALVAFAGCAKEISNEEVKAEGNVKILVSTNATKSVLDGTAINWAKDDAIVVNDGSADHTYTYSKEDEANKVVFTGSDKLETGTNYAFFPSTATFSGSTATFTLSDAQDGTGADIPMYATSTEKPCYELEFDVAAAVLKFQVAATTMPSAIKFSAAGIAGESTVDVTSGTVAAGKGEAVTVTASFAKETDYYVVVLPGTYADGIQISYTLNGEEVDYLAPVKDVEIVAGKLYDMGTINLNTWKLVDSEETLDECGDGEYMIAYWDGTTLRALSVKQLAANADEVAKIFQGGEGFQYFRGQAKTCYNTLVASNYIDITENHKGTALNGDETVITLPDEAEEAVATITMSGTDVTIENNYSLKLSIDGDERGIEIAENGDATIKGAFDVESVIGVVTKLNVTEPAWTVQTLVEAFASEDAARTHLYNMVEQMGYEKTDKLLDLARKEAARDGSMAVAAADLQNVVFDTTKDGFTLRCKTWDQMKANEILEVVNGYLNTEVEDLEVTDYASLAQLINSYLGTSFTADQVQKAFENVGTDGKANWDALIAKYKTKILNWEEKIKTYVGKGSETGDRYKNVQLWYKVGSGE